MGNEETQGTQLCYPTITEELTIAGEGLLITWCTEKKATG